MTRSQSGSIPTRAIGSLATILLGLMLVVGQIPSSGAAPAASRGAASSGRTATSSQQTSAQQQAAVDQAYGKLPLAFEANAGQTADADVRFLAHGTGYTLALATQAVTLSLRGSTTGSTTTTASAKLGDAASLVSQLAAPGPRAQTSAAAVSMRWVGGNAAPQISGEQQLPGVVNYFVGHDPSKWQTNVATYAQVRYHDVYPGIDLVYYGSQGGQLEYDFVVRPGGDPARIQLAYDGSQGMTLDAQGNLQLRLANGQTLTQQAPSIYQTVDGKQQTVAGGYRLGANGQVGFALGAYDHALPLTIDPQYRYVTYLGGNNVDGAGSIAIDFSGNAYIAGGTDSTNFPTTSGASQKTYGGGTEDAFVTKLNANGTALVYSTYLGGSADDGADGIGVDGAGYAYVVGSTDSTNFPTTSGASQKTYGGGTEDAFVTKLNPTGSALVYSTYLGGSGDDLAYAMALDASGNVYLTGDTNSTNLPVVNALQPTPGGSGDAFVSKVNSAGSALVYSTYLGGSGFDDGEDIALDGSGNAYVSGGTLSSNFPITSGVLKSTLNGQDVFVTKLNANGTALVYSTYLGGSEGEVGHGIAVDAGGDAFVTGDTDSFDFPVTPGAFQTTNRITLTPPFFSETTVFVSKLNPAGSALVYSTYLGGSTSDASSGITVDGAGYAYISGATSSSDFPLANPLQPSLDGPGDAFVVRLAPSGGGLAFGTFLGGSGFDGFGKSALGPAGTLYLEGGTNSSDLPHPNALFPASGGGDDAFVAKINVLPNAVQTVGAYDPSSGTFYLRTSNSGGPANLAFPFGPSGCLPLAGDWNGKGYDSIGVYCPSSGTFYLKNSNSGDSADFAFPFGPPNCLPLVGDWTGKNYDSVGVDCNGAFYLRNLNAGGNADAVIGYGPTSGCLPVAGDWTAKGYDSIGVYCSGTFYLRNSNTPGNANIGVAFGPTSGCVADTGDWTGKGYDSIGVDCSGTYYLRNSNTAGNADIAFPYGASSFKPLAGEWVPAPGSVAVHRNPAKK